LYLKNKDTNQIGICKINIFITGDFHLLRRMEVPHILIILTFTLLTTQRVPNSFEGFGFRKTLREAENYRRGWYKKELIKLDKYGLNTYICTCKTLDYGYKTNIEIRQASD